MMIPHVGFLGSNTVWPRDQKRAKMSLQPETTARRTKAFSRDGAAGRGNPGALENEAKYNARL